MKGYLSAAIRSAIAGWLLTSALHAFIYSLIVEYNNNYVSWISAITLFLLVFSALSEVLVLCAFQKSLNRLVATTQKFTFASLSGLYGLLMFCLFAVLWFSPHLTELLEFIRFEPAHFEPWSLPGSAVVNAFLFGLLFYSARKSTLANA